VNTYLFVLLLITTVRLNAQNSDLNNLNSTSNQNATRQIINQKFISEDFYSVQEIGISNLNIEARLNKKLVNNFIKKIFSEYLLLNKTYQMWENENWKDRSRSLYSYDSNNNIIQIIYESIDSAWKPNSRHIYTYDVNNNIIEFLNQVNRNGNWYDLNKTNYLLNENNKVIEKTRSQYNYSNNNWEYLDKELYAYRPDNLINEIEYDYWAGYWSHSGKDVYTYNGNNNIVKIELLDWVNSNYTNYYKDTIQYNENQKAIDTTGYHWVNEQWLNHKRIQAEYDSLGNMIIRFSQLWENNQWNNQNRFLSQFNNEHKLINLIRQGGGSWSNMERNNHYYDEIGNEIQCVIEYWVDTSWNTSTMFKSDFNEYNDKISYETLFWYDNVWNHYERIKYSYNNPSCVSTYSEVKKYSLMNNFPNPFNPSTTIQYAISSTQFVTLKVYDLLGREVATLVNEEKTAGNYEIEFGVKSLELSSGIYFYKLQAGEFVETKKMILLK